MIKSYAKVRSALAQIAEAIAILENGTDYEKLHVPYILAVGEELLNDVLAQSLGVDAEGDVQPGEKEKNG